MTHAQALTRLRKLLGKTATVRDYKRPSSESKRMEANAARRAARQEAEAVDSALEARRREILNADPEYVNLRDALKAAIARRDALPHPQWRYEVVTNWGGFNRVNAQADTLAELVDKVESDRVVL